MTRWSLTLYTGQVETPAAIFGLQFRSWMVEEQWSKTELCSVKPLHCVLSHYGTHLWTVPGAVCSQGFIHQVADTGGVDVWGVTSTPSFDSLFFLGGGVVSGPDNMGGSRDETVKSGRLCNYEVSDLYVFGKSKISTRTFCRHIHRYLSTLQEYTNCHPWPLLYLSDTWVQHSTATVE